MKKVCLLWMISLAAMLCYAQTVQQKMGNAVKQLQADSQMKHAIMSIVVVDSKAGKIVYEHNPQIGLAAASTQKIFTSAAAFELLGADYRYKTRLGYDGNIENGVLNGNLYVIGSGDPTLGSWRWKQTNDTTVLGSWTAAIKKSGINRIAGMLTTNESQFSHQSIPDGWIWQDIGNYYGAGTYSLNWKENQYEIILQSGNKLNDSVRVKSTKPENVFTAYVNELRSAEKGSGDNAYIYLYTAADRNVLLKGTIPINEMSFSISGAMVDPVSQLLLDLQFFLSANSVQSRAHHGKQRDVFNRDEKVLQGLKYFHTYYSPPLDSINYGFLRRSINLYGEALLKTIAYEKKGFGSIEKGVEAIKEFWNERGIDKQAINILDGSGLSPQNRVTAISLVKALQYARSRPWFNSFYESFPTYNGMKIKSGSIGGARAYAGYHTSKTGEEYIVVIIVNNYSGSATDVVKKMYRVLDVLK